ncbi:hypothetical protein QJS66_13645 [Kocuria rhizophila]|nr:hypothetical protein QJS66_13645 [Kocuria rhizophila]
MIAHLEQQGWSGGRGQRLTDGTRQFLEVDQGPLGLIVVDHSEPRSPAGAQDGPAGAGAWPAVPSGLFLDADESRYGRRHPGRGCSVSPRTDRQSAHALQRGAHARGLLGGQARPAAQVAFRPHRWAHLAHGNHSVYAALHRTGPARGLPYRSQEHLPREYSPRQQGPGQNREGAPAGHSWSDLHPPAMRSCGGLRRHARMGRGPGKMDWIPRPHGTLTEFPPRRGPGLRIRHA